MKEEQPCSAAQRPKPQRVFATSSLWLTRKTQNGCVSVCVCVCALFFTMLPTGQNANLHKTSAMEVFPSMESQQWCSLGSGFFGKLGIEISSASTLPL